jgi:hypothetical protein
MIGAPGPVQVAAAPRGRRVRGHQRGVTARFIMFMMIVLSIAAVCFISSVDVTVKAAKGAYLEIISLLF